MGYKVTRDFIVPAGLFREGHLVQADDIGADAVPGLVDGGFLVEEPDAAPPEPAAVDNGPGRSKGAAGKSATLAALLLALVAVSTVGCKQVSGIFAPTPAHEGGEAPGNNAEQ